MAYWPRPKGRRKSDKNRPKDEMRESISKQFPEAFVRAIRETPFPLSGDSHLGTPEHGYASTGVGLSELAKLQLQALNVSDLEELEFFAVAGKETLEEIKKAQAERAKQKTMDELKEIMNRINLTLVDLKTAEKALSVTPEVDLERRERIEEEKRKRKLRKKRRRSLMKKRMTRKVERKAREKEKIEEISDENEIKETGRLSRKKDREGKATPGEREGKITPKISKTREEGKITPSGKIQVKESEKREGIEEMGDAEGEREGRTTRMEMISEGTELEVTEDDQIRQREREKKGLESEMAEMAGTVDEDAEELKRQIAEGMKKIQIMAGAEAQEIEKQIAKIDQDLEQLSDISTSSEDEYSLGSDDMEEFDSWSSLSEISFASSEVHSDEEEVDYDRLKDDLTAPLSPPSLTEKAEQRRETSETIASFVERCLEREEQLLQLQSWMEAITAEELPASFQDKDEEALRDYSPDLLEEAKAVQVKSVLEEFKNSMKKLKDIADSLGIGEKEEAEPVTVEETPEKKPYTQRLPIPTKTKVQKVFNEEELAIPDNFNKAATTLSKTLDEAMKSCPSRRVRLGIAEGLKQFQFIVKVLESREERLHNMDKEILNMGQQQVKANRQVEDIRKAKTKVLVKCEKLENIVDDQKAKLTMTEKKIEELSKVVDEYKRRDSLGLFEESEEESELSSSTSSPSFGDLSTKRKAQKKKRKKAAQKEKQKGKGEKGAQKEKRKSEKSKRRREAQRSDEEETDSVGTKSEQATVEKIVVKPIDVERTEIYQNLNAKFEEVCNELQVEREKLAQIEKEFEKIKEEKMKYIQEKIDHKIEIEQLIRKQEVETEELRDEIANYEMENKKMKSEVESNEEMIQYQEERITQYAEEIQHLEEKLMGPLPETPAASSTSFAQTGASRRGRKVAEPPTARQMMAKIKTQYESEIQGLKDFISKENHRYQADSRRKELEHKRDIQNIHKESLQVLRCINRFKEGAANLLDRESLSVEAHAMRKLPPLAMDESPAEIRQMLAKMAILSNELLISMELQLSKALMSKRLEVKDTSNARAISQRELESQAAALRKAKDTGALQASKLKAAREEMMEYETLGIRFKIQEGEKREVIEERYKELYSEYIALKREGIAARKVERTEREKDEEINRKEALIMKHIRKEKALQRALDEQRKIIANLTSAWQLRRFGQYYIAKSEQMQNLETLKEALHEDRIRRGPCEMTTKLIKEAIDLPKRRFIELVQKYYRHVKMKQMEERVKRARMEESLGDKFVYMLERRIQKQRELWKKKREEFVQKRADLLMQLSKVLTRLSQEADVLLAKPKVLTVRAGQDASTGIPDLFEAVKILKERERAKEMMPMRVASRIPGDISPPMGVKIQYSGEDHEWKLKGRPSPSQVVIATPRILDLDVNMTRIAAQEILFHVSKMPWNQASQSLPALKTFTSRKFPEIQKSLSQPAPRKQNLFGEKRALTLPPIATFYSSEDIQQQEETKIKQ